MAGNFALSFSLNFLSIFVHISGSIRPITLIWVSFERSFPPVEVKYTWFQFWSKVMMSKVEERPRLVTAGYGRHRSQRVNLFVQSEVKPKLITSNSLTHIFHMLWVTYTVHLTILSSNWFTGLSVLCNWLEQLLCFMTLNCKLHALYIICFSRW